MQIGTVTLSRRAIVPVKFRRTKDQTLFVGGGGEILARDAGPEEVLRIYEIRNLPRDEFEDLVDFLTGDSGAGYKKNAFDIVDDWSVTHTVRWWDNRLQYTEKLGRLYDVIITFRDEN